MAYVTDHPEFARYYDSATRAPAQHGLVRQLADRLIAWRQRKADREVAAYIQRSGGGLTDSVERELMDRFTRSSLGEWRR